MSETKLDHVDYAFMPALYGGYDVPVLTVARALALFLERRRRKLSPRTEKSYQSRIGALVAHLGPDRPLHEVTIHDLRRFEDALQDRDSRYANGESLRPEMSGGLSPVTIREHIRAAKIFFNFLFDEEIIEVNPAARLKLPSADVEQKEGITTQALVEMVRAAKYGGNVRDYAFLLFFRDTGCRLGGALGLNIKRLFLERQECKLIEKGNKSRRAYYLPETGEALGAWLGERRAGLGHDLVFYGVRGEPLEDSGAYRVFQKYAKRAGVLAGEWNPHAWRHWRSREWERLGMPDSVRAQLLGHSLKSGGVTSAHYSKLSDAILREKYFEFTVSPG